MAGDRLGIRTEAKRKFAELLPTRVNTRDGNRNFRASINTHLMEAVGCTLAAAATHYNHAFIEARKAAATNPELATQLEGLGRPEDKKGGRKKKVVEVMTPNGPQEGMVLAEGTLEELQEALPTLFLVKKANGGEQVGEPMTLEDAKALVEAAKKAKKAKLFWIAA